MFGVWNREIIKKEKLKKRKKDKCPHKNQE